MEEIIISELMNTEVVTMDMHTRPLDLAVSMRDNRYSCIVISENEIPLGIVTERDIVRVFVDYYREKCHRELLLKDIITFPVITVTENTTLFDALVLIKSRMIRHLPVVDADGKLAGIVTYSDLVRNHQRLMDEQIDLIEEEVHNRTRELTEANDRLYALSHEDHLLKIGNRRAMEEDLEFTHVSAIRYKRPYCVSLIDMDYFKQYNDRYGHPAGDEILQKIVNYFKTTQRKSDRVYRYGGEEFLLLMPETLDNGAYTLMQRMLIGIDEMNIRHEGSPTGRITISTGIACENSDENPADSWKDVVARADKALYSAKQSGRNLCVVSDGSHGGCSGQTLDNKSAA